MTVSGSPSRFKLVPFVLQKYTIPLLRYRDIARCTRYKIELAQNGMVDGDSSTLPVSGRLQRLREYAYMFCNGNFDHEDLASHPFYAHQLQDLPTTMMVIGQHFTSNLHQQDGCSDAFLSVFTPGSAQAGTQSSRYLLPISMTGRHGLVIRGWAIDGEQDLLVMAETADANIPEQFRRRLDEFHIHFYSLSKSQGAGLMPHPAAAFPSLHFFASAAGMHEGILPMANIVELHIKGQYIIWELAATHGELCSMSVEVCDWRMGTVISRLDIGTQSVEVIPLDYPYLLLVSRQPQEDPYFNIYSFSPSEIPSRHVCKLRLPEEDLRSDERIEWHTIDTGDQPQSSEGHFHADLSHSMVVLQFFIAGLEDARETHYLIPRATFLAQIHHAESCQTLPMDANGVRPVPWADWGLNGCLRLRLRSQDAGRHTLGMPFGSRLPLLINDESDFRSAEVYVFDINPHVARHQRQVLAAREYDSLQSRETGTTAIIEDIEAVLPGVVPCEPVEWQYADTIGAVIMNMTGFTVNMAGVSEYEKTEQTWTV
ncbi:hypothetical protein V8D89_005054 [Ganoderma adspersum]